MSHLATLAACAGNWRGTNKLQDPHTGLPEKSPATATISPILGGLFIRFDYTWRYQDQPQEGLLLFGCDTSANVITAHWIDTWHMGEKVMACQGPIQGNNLLSVRGSYAAPPGPDWGWRIDLNMENSRSLQLVMYNVTPDGQEALAVDATFESV